MADKLLLEDGASGLLLEDGASFLLMEGTEFRPPSDITQLRVYGVGPYEDIGDKGGVDAVDVTDTVSLTLSETVSTLVSVDVTDTASLSISEAVDLFKTFVASDTASLFVSEAADIVVAVDVTDTASLSLTELAEIETTDASVEAESFPIGFFASFERARERARREREKRLQDEEEAQKLEDETSRQIAAFLHEQEAKDAERREIERLRSLVAAAQREKVSESFSERVQAAYNRATESMTTSALLAFQRELDRQMEEEEYAVLLLLLDD